MITSSQAHAAEANLLHLKEHLARKCLACECYSSLLLCASCPFHQSLFSVLLLLTGQDTHLAMSKQPNVEQLCSL